MEKFEITSGRIRVTDPCYAKDTWCAGVLENCMVGTWLATNEVSVLDSLSEAERTKDMFIGHHGESEWNTYHFRKKQIFDAVGDIRRPTSISIFREGFENVLPVNLARIIVGVDSGQAGFFDDESYPERGDEGWDEFYDKCFDGTCSMRKKVRITRFHPSDDRIQEIDAITEKYKNSGMSPETIESVLDMFAKDTVNVDEYANIANLGFGVNSRTFYGDGSYRCYYGIDPESGKIVSAKIVFYAEDEEDDYD